MFITISREFAAGGSEVAARVAEALDWTVLDNALVDQIAERSGLDPQDVTALEERVPSFLERMARMSALSSPETLLAAPGQLEEPQTVALARITRAVVSELGRRDRVVLVGRAAAAVLASERDAIHARIVASRAHRIRLAIELQDVPEGRAPEVVDDTDRNRERYHRELYGREWSDPLNYHLVLNTELLGTDGAADVIVSLARARGW
jgi:cytidylate kinase